MQRPSSRLIRVHSLISAFRSNHIAAVLNLQLSGEHSLCGDGISNKSGFSYEPEEFTNEGIYYYNFGWVDMSIPSLERMLRLVQCICFHVDRQQRVSIHCHAGYGRTGIAIACYFVYAYGLDAEKAIRSVRERREGSVQTKKQVRFVHVFQEYLQYMRTLFIEPIAALSFPAQPSIGIMEGAGPRRRSAESVVSVASNSTSYGAFGPAAGGGNIGGGGGGGGAGAGSSAAPVAAAVAPIGGGGGGGGIGRNGSGSLSVGLSSLSLSRRPSPSAAYDVTNGTHSPPATSGPPITTTTTTTGTASFSSPTWPLSSLAPSAPTLAAMAFASGSLPISPSNNSPTSPFSSSASLLSLSSFLPPISSYSLSDLLLRQSVIFHGEERLKWKSIAKIVGLITNKMIGSMSGSGGGEGLGGIVSGIVSGSGGGGLSRDASSTAWFVAQSFVDGYRARPGRIEQEKFKAKKKIATGQSLSQAPQAMQLDMAGTSGAGLFPPLGSPVGANASAAITGGTAGAAGGGVVGAGAGVGAADVSLPALPSPPAAAAASASSSHFPSSSSFLSRPRSQSSPSLWDVLVANEQHYSHHRPVRSNSYSSLSHLPSTTFPSSLCHPKWGIANEDMIVNLKKRLNLGDWSVLNGIEMQYLAQLLLEWLDSLSEPLMPVLNETVAAAAASSSSSATSSSASDGVMDNTSNEGGLLVPTVTVALHCIPRVHLPTLDCIFHLLRHLSTLSDPPASPSDLALLSRLYVRFAFALMHPKTAPATVSLPSSSSLSDLSSLSNDSSISSPIPLSGSCVLPDICLVRPSAKFVTNTVSVAEINSATAAAAAVAVAAAVAAAGGGAGGGGAGVGVGAGGAGAGGLGGGGGGGTAGTTATAVAAAAAAAAATSAFHSSSSSSLLFSSSSPSNSLVHLNLSSSAKQTLDSLVDLMRGLVKEWEGFYAKVKREEEEGKGEKGIGVKKGEIQWWLNTEIRREDGNPVSGSGGNGDSNSNSGDGVSGGVGVVDGGGVNGSVGVGGTGVVGLSPIATDSTVAGFGGIDIKENKGAQTPSSSGGKVNRGKMDKHQPRLSPATPTSRQHMHRMHPSDE